MTILGAAGATARVELPLYGCRVAAGFPSPADDYIEGKLDLNELLVSNPSATFFVRVTGESMTGAGILPSDILVVDRSVAATHGRVVIAVLDGELTVKRFTRVSGQVVLQAENPAFEPIIPSGDSELTIWGVVTGVVREL